MDTGLALHHRDLIAEELVVHVISGCVFRLHPAISQQVIRVGFPLRTRLAWNGEGACSGAAEAIPVNERRIAPADSRHGIAPPVVTHAKAAAENSLVI